VRLRTYDYARAGAYFVTICTTSRENVFGAVEDGAMHLNAAGVTLDELWRGLPIRFPGVAVGELAIMPDHLHGIVFLTGEGASLEAGAMNRAPTHRNAMNRAPTQPDTLRAVALGEVVRALKAVAARRLRMAGHARFAWQRNYYEHVIRNDADLERIRWYIANNPAAWEAGERDRSHNLSAGDPLVPTSRVQPPS